VEISRIQVVVEVAGDTLREWNALVPPGTSKRGSLSQESSAYPGDKGNFPVPLGRTQWLIPAEPDPCILAHRLAVPAEGDPGRHFTYGRDGRYSDLSEWRTAAPPKGVFIDVRV
jgi:hypothetical protein